MNILEIIQQACREMSLPVPNTVVSATDPLTLQLLGLAEAGGQEWVSDHEWQPLINEHTFSLETLTDESCGVAADSGVITGISDTSDMEAETWQCTGDGLPQNCTIQSVDSATQVTVSPVATSTDSAARVVFTKTRYALPSDWNRQIDRTHWDRTNQWEMIGPKTAQERQWLKSGIVSTGPRIRFWIDNDKFVIWPIENNAALMVYEYITHNWIKDSVSTSNWQRQTFENDTDVVAYRDRLMINAIKHKFKDEKGFDTTLSARDYEMEVSKAKSQNKGAATLSLQGNKKSQILISPANVPDGNVFGQ